MTGFVIGSVYSLKNKPEVYYIGDQGGALHFLDATSGQTLAITLTDLECCLVSEPVASIAKVVAETETNNDAIS